MTMKIRKYSAVAAISMISVAASAAAPLWIMTPTEDSNIHQTVGENVLASVEYTVANQSKKPKNLALYPTAGLRQLSSCPLAPKGQPGDSCTIRFEIIGQSLPASGLKTGPVLCQANPDGSANQNQCYLPSPQNILDIKKAPPLQNWDNWGQNTNNTHHNLNSGIYGESDVQKIINLCKIDYTEGSESENASLFSTSSKPVIVGDVIYWTAFAGKIGAHQIMRDQNGKFISCHKKWVKDVSVITDLEGAPLLETAPSVRSSPAFYTRPNDQGTLLYIAYSNIFSLPADLRFSTPPIAFALDAETGEKLWQIQLVDEASVAFDGDAVAPTTTSSPRIYENTAYVGLASLNNVILPVEPPPHLTFRGHMIALDLGGNGLAPDLPSVKWTQYTIPPKPDDYEPGTWFAGGGVWGSTPSIIPELGLVIFGSGQLYNYPDFTADCMEIEEFTDFGTFVTTKKGETGKGAQECLLATEQTLKEMGITQPLATNSIIALHMKDGTYAWHVPTAGIDSWQSACGPEGDMPCNVPVVGPDWDVGGNSPLVATLPNFGQVVIGHNKGGEIFWIAAKTGTVLRKADVCTGSALGGIHWGISYDSSTQTIFAPCSGGMDAPSFNAEISFLSKLANGAGYCKIGYLNAIDAVTGALKWQAIPAVSQLDPVGSETCPDVEYQSDRQFKYGLNFEVVIKNQILNVPVHPMPESDLIPLKNQGKARSNGVPAISNGIVYWPVYYGMLYALEANTGKFIAQMSCDEGALYTAGPSTANGLVSFGCGYGTANPVDVGRFIMVYGLDQAFIPKS